MKYEEDQIGRFDVRDTRLWMMYGGIFLAMIISLMATGCITTAQTPKTTRVACQDWKPSAASHATGVKKCSDYGRTEVVDNTKSETDLDEELAESIEKEIELSRLTINDCYRAPMRAWVIEEVGASFVSIRPEGGETVTVNRVSPENIAVIELHRRKVGRTFTAMTTDDPDKALRCMKLQGEDRLTENPYL